jgi:MFS transporter, AAHS family, 4-hydroxybenzoate transporter
VKDLIKSWYFMPKNETVVIVEDVVDASPISAMQFRLIALCSLVIVFDGLDVMVMGFLAPAMADGLHVPVHEFGLVFSAALVGLMLGGLILGPLADKLGRRKILVASTILFSLLTIVTPMAKSVDELIWCRLLVGIGLGGAMPNAIATAFEYSPKRTARTAVSIVFCGMPAGGILAGVLCTTVPRIFGWPAVFYIGGAAPLLVAIAIICFVPESLRFLIARGASVATIARIVGRISAEYANPVGCRFVVRNKHQTDFPVRRLFAGGRAWKTIFLWIPCIMNLMILYFIGSWLPSMLRSTDLPPSTGEFAVLFFNTAGLVSVPVQGFLLNRFGPEKVLSGEFSLYIVLALSLSVIGLTSATVIAVVFMMGLCIQGAQAALNALAAETYPEDMRSTGLGWALGVGRVGSIIGPLLGGVMLSMSWNLRGMFIAAVIPALVALLAMLIHVTVARELHVDSKERRLGKLGL